MDNLSLSPKIIGAIIVGFALVAGTYVMTNFGEPSRNYQTANVQSSDPTQRVAIAVVDEDQNGIEDWRDDFLDADSITVEEPEPEAYEPPQTITGQVGINLVESLSQSKMSGLFGASNQEIVDNTVDALAVQLQSHLYDVSDIEIMTEWNDEDIVNYANTLASTIISNSKPELDFELDILYDITKRGQNERLDDLKELAQVFTNYRDDALKVPTPEIFAKEQLDLINSYTAVVEDLNGMLLVNEDPIVSMLHVNRYQDDALALTYAFQNIYSALEPHADLFVVEDPAVIFVLFSPDYQL